MDTGQLVVSLLTIAMSGVASAVVTYKLTASRDERRFRRQRLEEVFRAFSGFSMQLGVHWMYYVNVMTGKLDYNQALDMVIAKGKDEERHLEKLQVLVALYWPELTGMLGELMAVRDKANDVIGEHRVRYKAGLTSDKASFDAMGVLIRELESVEQRFAEAARAHAKHLQGAG